MNPKEVKVIFVGRENEFSLGIVDWLAENYSLKASFFIESNRNKIRLRVKLFFRRIKKYGFLKAFDEICFHIFYWLFFLPKDKKLMAKLFPRQFSMNRQPEGKFFRCEDIHQNDTIELIKSLSPDFIFSLCTNTIFKKEISTIPRFGHFLLHEGVVPEYKGLHTIAWAILKKDYEKIGYSLIKINDKIDGGDVLCSGVYEQAKQYGFQWGFIGHSALLNSLLNVKEVLDELFINNHAFVVDVKGRTQCTYTWLGFTEYLKYKVQ